MKGRLPTTLENGGNYGATTTTAVTNYAATNSAFDDSSPTTKVCNINTTLEELGLGLETLYAHAVCIVSLIGTHGRWLACSIFCCEKVSTFNYTS